jgi:hypothetical protein
MRDSIPDPQAEATFLASKLDLAERSTNAPTYRLYQQLLALRRGDPVLSTGDRAATRAFAVGARVVVVHRWLGTAHRMLVANFGAAASLPLADTPGLEAVAGADWRLLLSTADREFGGSGSESGREAGLCGSARDRRLTMPGRSAAIFTFEISVEEIGQPRPASSRERDLGGLGRDEFLQSSA